MVDICTTLILTLSLAAALVTSIAIPTLDDYTHNAVLDADENFHVYWKFDKEKIIFEINVRTTGWVGFGFSPNGGMPGSDIVIGWVLKDGNVKFTDRHATAYSEPIVDSRQDYKLLLGKEEDGFTIFKFERLIDTCDDEYDWQLKRETTRVIWAYHAEDPASVGGSDTVLRHTHRGSKSIWLLSIAESADRDLGEDVKTFDLLSNNYHLPAKDTTYYCMGYKLPALDTKHHMIAYAPIITKGNEANVHHILIFQCRFGFNETLHHGIGHQCRTPNMPWEWYYCYMPFVGWAVGGETFYFPENAGFSLGDENDPTHVMVEIHYDNPESLGNIYDSSGIRIFYSSNLREYDANFVVIGQDVNQLLVIPPGVEEFRVNSYCTAEMTQEGFIDGVTGQPTNVTIFAVGLHTHLIGKAVSVTHVREGQDYEVIMKDDHYDFNLQEIYKLPREVQVEPGDELICECVYDSTGRDSLTYGGYSTKEEMCLAFLYVYPRTALEVCFTHTAVNETLLAAGILDVDSSRDPPMVLSPSRWENMTIHEVFDDIEWDEQTKNEVQRANNKGYKKSVSFGMLGGYNWEKKVVHRPIEIPEKVPPPRPNCQHVTSTAYKPERFTFILLTTTITWTVSVIVLGY
ncbi:DBH-like monooxygenase protein 1 homolog [Ptychodera flava]|uniref:DBH-like monooxygenase protein 1 homolog n=1 Tax=Ptychodera flava TaxID=63121 RepID=UPI003969D31D